jgi:type III pantothenate kinase
MAMVAAYRMTQSPVIVVDCGTAVTIDLVNEKGLFIGGVIMPGLMTALQSLKIGTDAVEDICRINSDASPASQSTEEGVIAGVLLGLAGGIERVVREQSLLVDQTPTVLISGGDREKIVPYLTIPVVLQPGLVLEGLRIVAGKNKSEVSRLKFQD